MGRLQIVRKRDVRKIQVFCTAKLSTLHCFTKGVSGCFILINKWHSWEQSALRGIRLYVQSGSDEYFRWCKSGKLLIEKLKELKKSQSDPGIEILANNPLLNRYYLLSLAAMGSTILMDHQADSIEAFWL